jgi:hypothetical protein
MVVSRTRTRCECPNNGPNGGGVNPYLWKAFRPPDCAASGFDLQGYERHEPADGSRDQGHPSLGEAGRQEQLAVGARFLELANGRYPPFFGGATVTRQVLS